MKIQIVIPSYNQGDFIGDAVGSVLTQATDAEVELVVIDGASTDASVSVVRSAFAQHDTARTVLVSEPDDGQPQAINKGIALGSGEVVGWLNADDRLLPGALATVARAFAEAAPDVAAIYGDVRHIDRDGRPLREYREQKFRRYDLMFGVVYVPQPSTFVARWAWERVGGVREDLQYALDPDLWLRLSQVGRIVHIPTILSEFRWHEKSKSGSQRPVQFDEVMKNCMDHVEHEFGRRPTAAEFYARRTMVRAWRKVRFARRALLGGEA